MVSRNIEKIPMQIFRFLFNHTCINEKATTLIHPIYMCVCVTSNGYPYLSTSSVYFKQIVNLPVYSRKLNKENMP